MARTTMHTTLHCTQHYNAHNTTLHTTLHCTQHYIAHNTTLHTTLQCTQHCIAHNTTLHTTLHCTQHYIAHNMHTTLHCTHADPYGKINLIFKGQRVAKWKSSTKINSLAPVYNEAFHFEVRKMDISDISLQFILLDEDKLHTGQDGTIGYIVLGDHSPSESGCKQWASIKSNPGTSFTSWHSLIAK